MLVFILIAVFVVLAVPAAIARLLIRLRPAWSGTTLVLVAAASVAVLFAVPGLWGFSIETLGPEPAVGGAGSDGYREMFALFGLAGAPVAYGIGLISAATAVITRR